MQFKEGNGWKACYDEERNLYTAERSNGGFYGLRIGAPEVTLPDVFDGKTKYNNRPVRAEKTKGTSFEYSDAGYCVLQQMMEDVTGKPNESIVKEMLFVFCDLSADHCLGAGSRLCHGKMNGEVFVGSRGIKGAKVSADMEGALTTKVSRIKFAVLALLLLITEVLIGTYARGWVRYYLGDVLVVILLYALVRSISPKKPGKWYVLPTCILIFAIMVEFLQLWGFCDRLGITNKLLRIIIGTGFSWVDILSYAIGILPCYVVDYFSLKSYSGKGIHDGNA